MGALRLVRNAILALAALAVFLVLVFVVSEAALRYRQDVILARPLCVQEDPQELVRMKPHCRSQEDSPAGPYEFATNEDGFRDRARSEFPRGAWFVLGDSHVEGYRLSLEQGLVRQLEARLRVPLLNLGMQGLGPSQEALRARRALESYRSLGVLWFLNPTDPLDEIFYQALRDPANRQAPPLHGLWQKLFRAGGSRFLVLKKLQEYLYLQRPFARLTVGKSFEPAQHCQAIRELDQKLKELRLPLAFVVMGQGPRGFSLPYRGQPVNDEKFLRLVACARETGRPIADTRDKFPDPQLYWHGDWHFTPEGTARFAAFVADELRSAVPQLPR